MRESVDDEETEACFEFLNNSLPTVSNEVYLSLFLTQVKNYYKFNVMHAAFGHFLHWFYPIYLIIAFALPKVKKQKTMVETAAKVDENAPIKVSEQSAT